MDDNNRNTGNDGDFSYMQEKIKPKTRKRIRKAFSVAGLALLAGVIFGITARVTFLLSDEPLARVLGIETQKEQPDPLTTSLVRSEVTFPTNPVAKMPTRVPTKEPVRPSSDESVKPSSDEPVQGKRDDNNDPDHEDNVATGTDDPPSGTDIPVVTSASPVPDTVTSAVDPADISPTPETGSDAGTGDALITGTETGEGDEGQQDTSTLEGYLAMIARMREIAVKAQESLVRVYSVKTGVNWMDESIETRQELTGVLMGNNGIELLILADYNMVSGADRLEAELSDGKAYNAALYGFDPDSNMAVISIELADLPADLVENIKYMQLGDSEGLSCGEPVIAIGRPNGYYGAIEFGYVSHTGLYGYILDGCMDEFMTDFTFTSNGDGVVTDISGSLIGFIPYSEGGAEAKNRIVGINQLRSIILKLLNGSDVPLFGIRSEDIPSGILENMGIDNGIYVNEVLSASPAGKAGIKKGDVIMKLGNEEINSVSEFYELLLQMEAGKRVEVSIYRASRPDNPYSIENVVLGRK